jgi:hypothetical protein
MITPPRPPWRSGSTAPPGAAPAAARSPTRRVGSPTAAACHSPPSATTAAAAPSALRRSIISSPPGTGRSRTAGAGGFGSTQPSGGGKPAARSASMMTLACPPAPMITTRGRFWHGRAPEWLGGRRGCLPITGRGCRRGNWQSSPRFSHRGHCSAAMADGTANPMILWLDVEDFFHYGLRYPRPSGIQRLSYELYAELHGLLASRCASAATLPWATPCGRCHGRPCASFSPGC